MSKIKDIKLKMTHKLWVITTLPNSSTELILSPNFIRSLSQIKTWLYLWYMFYECFQVKIPSDFHMLKMMVWEISNNAAVIKLTIRSLLLAAKIKWWKSVLARLSIRISFEEVILYPLSHLQIQRNGWKQPVTYDVNLPSV